MDVEGQQAKPRNRVVQVLWSFILGAMTVGWPLFLYYNSHTKAITARLSAYHQLPWDDLRVSDSAGKGRLLIEVVNTGQESVYVRQASLRSPCDSRWGTVVYGGELPDTNDKLRLNPGQPYTFKLRSWDFSKYPVDPEKACLILELTTGEVLSAPIQLSSLEFSVSVPRNVKK